MVFGEKEYDEHFLNVHFYNGFANQRGAEKGPKRDEKMATGDSGQIEKWVRD